MSNTKFAKYKLLQKDNWYTTQAFMSTTSCSSLKIWRWRVLSIRRYLYTNLEGIITRKAVIFISTTARTSNIALPTSLEMFIDRQALNAVQRRLTPYSAVWSWVMRPNTRLQI